MGQGSLIGKQKPKAVLRNKGDLAASGGSRHLDLLLNVHSQLLALVRSCVAEDQYGLHEPPVACFQNSFSVHVKT